MRRLHALFATLAVLALAAAPARAATIQIVNSDPAGVGFNDPTVVAPVGGNPGTTLGAQRLYVFQYAANLWGAILPSSVTIQVNSTFEALTCTATSAVLGSAGPVTVFRDFGGAPLAAHWYHAALADKLAGTDLDGGTAYEIRARFNVNLGNTGCLTGTGWYLGVDGNEGSSIELLAVVLHELGHGLGFSTTTSGSSGSYLSGFPSVFDRYIHDGLQDRSWDDPAETSADRIASAISCNQLSWSGPSVTFHAGDFLASGTSKLRVSAPAGVAGDYDVGLASFGPAPSTPGVTGQVVLVNDGTGTTSDGCEAILNDLTGKIAFIDRGTCTFVIKAKNAQNAGAIGVIIADNAAGCPPAGLGGTDPTITIPTVRITLDDGNLLRAQIGSGLTASILQDPGTRPGEDAAGRLKLYAPNPYQSGSSVSHWDTSAEPSLLMEPAITQGLSSTVDLTRNAFIDIGWFHELADVPVPTASQRLEPSAPNPTASGTRIAWSLAKSERVDLRVFDLFGREVVRLVEGPMTEGRHTLTWDGTDATGHRVAPGVYRCRLSTPSFSESRSVIVVQ